MSNNDITLCDTFWCGLRGQCRRADWPGPEVSLSQVSMSHFWPVRPEREGDDWRCEWFLRREGGGEQKGGEA